ncbi:MAG: glycosyltransferase family 39 protein [Terriglobales bacterium]
MQNQTTTTASESRALDAQTSTPALAVGLVASLAGAKLLIHLALSGRYGYFRDELYYLDCGRRLDWGYVDHAPMIGLVAKAALLLGGSLHVLRMFPAIEGALLVALTMLITWRLGGDRFAQGLAGLAVLVVPIYLAIDSMMTMNALEPVLWMSCIYALIRIIQTGNSSLWIWFGVFAGLGLMNKHSTGFFGISVVVGLLLTEQRREFAKRWIWLGALIAILIFSPNLIWQIHHHFPTLEDLHNVRVSGKNVVLPPLKFIGQQILTMNPTLFPIWLAGLWWVLLGRGSKYRPLGWIFLAFFLTMMALHGKDYYVAPIYPMLLAAGAVALEVGLRNWRFTSDRIWPKVAVLCVVAANGVLIAPLMLPLMSPSNYVAYANWIGFKPARQEVNHESVLPQIFADQFGWPELVDQVAQFYNSLPADTRSKTAILTGNYGEAGAIDLFGPKYQLPAAISGHQTFYYWGTRGFAAENLITLQYGPMYLGTICDSVHEVAVHSSEWGMAEENHAIYFCQGLKKPLEVIWPDQKHWN